MQNETVYGLGDRFPGDRIVCKRGKSSREVIEEKEIRVGSRVRISGDCLRKVVRIDSLFDVYVEGIRGRINSRAVVEVLNE